MSPKESFQRHTMYTPCQGRMYRMRLIVGIGPEELTKQTASTLHGLPLQAINDALLRWLTPA